ncbi:MAG: mechanosensitive ion channel family protein [Pseudooceanicola sp.]|nr:mechanosensitive ion channel family protein [Pseudooceanicola sp.]
MRLLAPVLALLLSLSVAFAQEDGPNYETWTRVAAQAEDVTERGRASDEAMEALRSQLVDWREQFLTAEGRNADRIATLRSQIAALGPVPESGTEAEDVAARRAELTDQLNRLRAPVIAAEEAYLRADGLIREIDSLIRERRTNRLLELGPSPLDPRHWAATGAALLTTAHDLSNEAIASWGSATGRARLLSNLPVTIPVLLLGLLLIVRGRVWIIRLVKRMREWTRKGSGVWRLMVSLGQIVLPLVGLVLLVTVIDLSGMVGPRATTLVQGLPVWGATVLLVWWLGDEVFSRVDELATVPIDAGHRAEARVHIGILALCLAAHDMANLLVSTERYAAEIANVLELPVMALTGLSLFRLGHILSGRTLPPPETDGESGQNYARRLMWFIGRAAMVVGVAGPLMLAVGYGQAALALVYPGVGTLILLGVLTVLQRLVFDLYHLVTGERDAEQGGLIPVLAGFVLILAALPVLALIWGARTADLTEIWARFREGYSFGETRVSPGDFLTFVLVFVIGYMATRLLQGGLRNSVLPKTRIDPGGQTALLSGIGYVGIFVSALIAITSAGIDLTALGYVAGALSVGIGFGLQNIVSNFVSGIILLIERPISKGDWIAVGGQMGYVRDISVRSTRIETFDRTDVIVPNSDLISGTVTNYTRGNTIGRVIVPVGVAYGTDTKKVERILREIAEAQPMVLANPPPNVVFRAFGADSLDFEIRAILRDVNWSLAVHSDINHEIARRFTEEGIEIPFAQRDVWLRNPEALRGPAPETVAQQAAAKDAPEESEAQA